MHEIYGFQTGLGLGGRLMLDLASMSLSCNCFPRESIRINTMRGGREKEGNRWIKPR